MFYKMLFCLGLLFSVCAGLADTDPILLPPVKNDEDKLKVLMSIHEQIPELFSDAARYDIDLFQILDEQEELQELLRKNPEYMELWNERKFLDLSFEIKDDNAKAIETKQVKASAVDLWKQNLKEVLGKYQEKKIELEILERLNNAKNYSSGGFLNGLVLNLPKDLQLKFREMQKVGTQTQDELIQYLRQNLPDFLPQFKAQGIEANPKRDDLIKKLLEIRKIENELGPLMDAYILMSGQNVDARELLNNIDNLTRQDLVNLSDPDYQKPAFLKLTKNKDTKIPNAYLKHLQNFLSQTETVKSEMADGYQVMIKEQNPHVAIFRGCTGGDCSSQFSFPYPNDPHERVFFIYDGKDRLKGYVSATVVEDAKKNKSLYVITIAGNRVNAQDTELILQGLDANKEALGVSKIMLPEKEKQNILLNFAPINDVFHQAVGNRPAENIHYQDEKIRLQIQTYKSDNNNGAYDHIAHNAKGVEYVPENKINIKTQITQVPPQLKSLVIKNSFEPTAVIEFCQALKSSSREDYISKTLDLTFDNGQKKEAAEKLMKIISEDLVMTSDKLNNEIEQLVSILEISPERFREKRGQWFINNLLNTSDGLEEKNLSKNLDLIAWDFKNNNPPLIDSKIFEKYEKEFVNHKSYLKLQNLFLKKLKDNPLFIDDLEKNDPRMRLVFAGDVPGELFPTSDFIIKNIEKLPTENVKISEVLYQAMASPNWEDKRDILTVMKKIKTYRKYDSKILNLVLKAAKDYRHELRAVAIDILGSVVRPEDPEILFTFSKDPNVSVRAQAVKSLYYAFPLINNEQKKAIIEKMANEPRSHMIRNLVEDAHFMLSKENMADVYKLILEKAVILKDSEILQQFAIKVLSHYDTKDMIDVYKTFIEKAVEMKKPEPFLSFIEKVLSGPHTKDMIDIYKDFINAMVKLKDWRLFERFAEKVLSQPHTKDMFDVYKLFFEKIPRGNQEGIIMSFIEEVWTQDHVKNMVGIQELMFDKMVKSIKDEGLLDAFVKKVMSQPNWGNLDHMHKKYLNKVVEMDNRYLLREYAADVLSKPYTKDMVEIYKLFIEKVAEMKDPYAFIYLIQYSLSREHTKDMAGVHQLLVEKAVALEDERIFQNLSYHVLSKPHTQNNLFYDSLRKICKTVSDNYNPDWDAVKKMIENEFADSGIVNLEKKASGIQQCLSEGLK